MLYGLLNKLQIYLTLIYRINKICMLQSYKLYFQKYSIYQISLLYIAPININKNNMFINVLEVQKVYHKYRKTYHKYNVQMIQKFCYM